MKATFKKNNTYIVHLSHNTSTVASLHSVHYIIYSYQFLAYDFIDMRKVRCIIGKRKVTLYASKSGLHTSGIEWSLRAFASMRAVRLFLRARAVVNFLMRAASTLEITNGEQRALR